MMGDEDDVLEAIDDGDDDDGAAVNSTLLENTFGVDEDEAGRIVLARRPGARLEQRDALNLAAWIVAATGVDIGDFEELVRTAIEGVE